MSETELTSRPTSQSSRSIATLEGEDGFTTIADSVIEKIAALAAREVNGVASLGGAVSGAIGNMLGRVRGQEHRTAGVGVEVGTRQAAVDISMTVMYPASIHEVADSVRQNVKDRIQTMTGLEVTEVNIAVTDLAFPESGGEQAPTSGA
jgi:uncharacterized alkaline shock family protein YloU